MININYLKANFLFSLLWRLILHTKVIIFNWYSHTPFIVPSFVGFVILTICFFVFRKLWNIKMLLQQEAVFLELTPPAFTEKTAYTTQQLFSVLHHLGSQRTLWEKLFGKKELF